MKDPLAPRRRFPWPFAFTVVALAFLALLAFIFSRLEGWPARTASQGAEQLERLGRDVRNAVIDIVHLQPRIAINDRVYSEQTSATAELALVNRRTEVEHEFTHTWAGSTKRVRVHGTFEVKAGFDLQRNVNVEIAEKEIAVQMPHAKILGVEEKKLEILALESGFWNRISPADLEKELAALPELARVKAEQTGLAQEAERSLQKQLTSRLHEDRPIRLTFVEQAVKP